MGGPLGRVRLLPLGQCPQRCRLRTVNELKKEIDVDQLNICLCVAKYFCDRVLSRPASLPRSLIRGGGVIARSGASCAPVAPLHAPSLHHAMTATRGRWPTERRCPGQTLPRLAPFHHRPHQCCRRQQVAWESGSPASPDTLGWPRHPARSVIGLVRHLGGGPRRHLYPWVEVRRPVVASVCHRLDPCAVWTVQWCIPPCMHVAASARQR